MSTHRSASDSDVTRIEYTQPRALTFQTRIAATDRRPNADDDEMVGRTHELQVDNVEAVEYFETGCPWYRVEIETTHDSHTIPKVLDILEPSNGTDSPRDLLPRVHYPPNNPHGWTEAEVRYRGYETSDLRTR